MSKKIDCFSFFTGITYPFRTVNLVIKKPYLWQYLIIPIIVNFIVGIILYVSFFFPSWKLIQNLILKFSLWLEQLINDLPSWLHFLTYLLLAISGVIKFVFVLALFILIGFVIVQFGCILGAPWYGKLSEELEKIKTGEVEIIEVNIFVDIWRAILFEIKKLALLVIIGIPLLLLNFIPTFGNLISTIGFFILTATIVCLDFIDSPLERRRLRFRQKLSLIWQGFPATAGFSLICLGLISIPFFNLLIIPICVASGTLFFCDFLLKINN